MAELMRLDKFISSQIADLSRKDVRELCKKGQITINSIVTKKSDEKVNPEIDIVSVNGNTISYKKHIYIMLNKPQGVVCSTKDGVSKTVISLLPKELQRKGLFPAGRLDKDTEGFVFITDDGELAHKMLSPKKHVPKKYYVELEKLVENEYIKMFLEGLKIDGGDICKPAELISIDNNPKSCYVILHQGMFHQVKRMFEAVGNKVVYLKRISIGGLDLDENLALGEWLVLLHKDVERIL